MPVRPPEVFSYLRAVLLEAGGKRQFFYIVD